MGKMHTTWTFYSCLINKNKSIWSDYIHHFISHKNTKEQVISKRHPCLYIDAESMKIRDTMTNNSGSFSLTHSVIYLLIINLNLLTKQTLFSTSSKKQTQRVNLKFDILSRLVLRNQSQRHGNNSKTGK